MANSTGGLTLAQIAEESLRVLSPRLIALRNFTRDFSADVAEQGDSVTTRVATEMTADDVSSGFTASDVTSTPYKIDLDKELGKSIAFSQKEMSTMTLERLERTFLPHVIHSVGKGVIQEVLKLVLAATFTNSPTSSTAANFDADDVADIATALNNLNVGDERFGILMPDYYGAVAKDAVVEDLGASGSDEALREHKVSRLRGFDLHMFNGFPATVTGGTEKLRGIFGAKEALLIAARTPFMPDQDVVEVENVIEPVTGFPMQFQKFYVAKERKFYLAVATLFGVKVGLINNLHRVVTP